MTIWACPTAWPGRPTAPSSTASTPFRASSGSGRTTRAPATTASGGCCCDIDGAPDGMCVDEDGNLWIAIWGAGEIRCYTPAGEQLAVVRVPAPHTSSVAFIGADLGHPADHHRQQGAHRGATRRVPRLRTAVPRRRRRPRAADHAVAGRDRELEHARHRRIHRRPGPMSTAAPPWRRTRVPDAHRPSRRTSGPSSGSTTTPMSTSRTWSPTTTRSSSPAASDALRQLVADRVRGGAVQQVRR